MWNVEWKMISVISLAFNGLSTRLIVNIRNESFSSLKKTKCWHRCALQTLKRVCETRCSRRRHTSPPVPLSGDLDQTTLSNVWLVPPPGELDETYMSFLILTYFLHYMKTWRHPQNRKYKTYRTAVRRYRATAMGNTYRRFDDIWTCVFEKRKQTDKQTYRHADHNTSNTWRGRRRRNN